ncbi:MAG: hypothetical protein ABJJ69_15515 [Paracoccaceae bacterium]
MERKTIALNSRRNPRRQRILATAYRTGKPMWWNSFKPQLRHMLKNSLCLAAFLSSTTAGIAASVPGFNDVTDNGDGSFTFLFDTIIKDLSGSGLSFSNSTDINFDVTASRDGIPAAVVQAAPFSGGLGVAAGLSENILEDDEMLHFSFDHAVNLLTFTLSDQFNDIGSGGFSLQTGLSTFFGPAANFDGQGDDPFSDATFCVSFHEWCGTTEFSFGTSSFEGFVESITVEIAPPVISAVPVPPSLTFMVAGLAGFGVMSRKRASK